MTAQSKRARRVAILAVAFTVAAAPLASAATITIVNQDGAGEGFNDPSPRVPVGGNSGTTLGEQRLEVFQFAADRWAALLDSPVEIRVGAKFDPLTCGATSAVLGSAGPATVTRDFSGAPLASTWYSIAEANALAGTDLAPGSDDITATFNSAIGTTCPFPQTWYYGLDGNPTPGTIDLASVVLHELGHGLGFLSLVDLSTGAKFLSRDDVYMFHLARENTGKIYPDMTDLERASANVATSNLVWVGSSVVDGSDDLTSGAKSNGHVEMYAPNPAQPGSSVSHFSTSLSPNEVMEPSYTGPNHDLTRSVELFADLGWPLVAQAMCGDATDDGSVASTDALVALKTSVGADSCGVEVCDVNSTMAVTATDALLILEYAVGQGITLSCP